MKGVISAYLLMLNFIGASECLQLSQHIGDYQTLEYDQSELRERHLRSKRSTDDKLMKVNITAFGSEFLLRLHPDTETFHPDTMVETNGVEEKLDTSHLYQGTVEDHPGSRVSGAITDGIFQGRIVLNEQDTYRVERKEHYRDNKDLTENTKAHSVIYHEDSVDLDQFYKEMKERNAAAAVSSCGNSNHNTRDWMDRVKRSSIPNTEGYVHTAGDNPYLRSKRDNLYSYSREKRNTIKTTCNLFMQGDPELWSYFELMFNFAASDEQIREEISALFHDHAQEVNTIYTKTTFRKTGDRESFTQFGFRITRVLINKTCEAADYDVNPFCSSNIDASNLLNLNSYKNHDAYCLAYVFTYRDFDGGTLGLAWVAEPGTAKGGICSEHSPYSAAGGPLLKSLNTGIVTLQNYQKRVPPLVTKLTFAHELGHNFGSQHDEEGMNPSCTPETDGFSADGNYIMFASATTGTKSNNDDFSECSKNSIATVLYSVVYNRNGKKNCFADSTGAWCGNQIAEDAEICDCGYSNDCPASDPNCCRCCVGQSDDNNNDEACKLRLDSRVACDPSQGPCCNANCGFVDPATLCRPAGECTHNQTCNTSQAKCPASDHKDDGSPCSQNTQICKSGECSGSLCELIDLKTKPWISCEPARDNSDDTLLCYLACRQDNVSRCWSSSAVEDPDFPSQFKDILDEHNLGLQIPMTAGHICDQEKGFCDHFQKCRLINAQGPLARLKDLIFSDSTLQMITEWVTVYWYVVALSIIGFIALMVLFVKCCAVHTPSSNPKKAPARRISQTLTLRRRQQTQAATNREPGQRPQERQPRFDPPRDSSGPPKYSDVISAEYSRPAQPANQRSAPKSSRPQSREQRQQQYEMQQQQLQRGNRR